MESADFLWRQPELASRLSGPARSNHSRWRSTARRFPSMVNKGDITKLNGKLLFPVDIICGGSPCQDLSVAGARAGLAGARSGLFMEQIRIIKEMRAADRERGRTGKQIRPRFMLWENVPGAFSSGDPKGEDFRIVLEEILRIHHGRC